MIKATNFGQCPNRKLISLPKIILEFIPVPYFLLFQIKEAVHCMMACLSLSPPPRVEARVRLQLGLTLYHHSNNLLEARETLEQAVSKWKVDAFQINLRFYGR